MPGGGLIWWAEVGWRAQVLGQSKAAWLLRQYAVRPALNYAPFHPLRDHTAAHTSRGLHHFDIQGQPHALTLLASFPGGRQTTDAYADHHYAPPAAIYHRIYSSCSSSPTEDPTVPITESARVRINRGLVPGVSKRPYLRPMLRTMDATWTSSSYSVSRCSERNPKGTTNTSFTPSALESATTSSIEGPIHRPPERPP